MICVALFATIALSTHCQAAPDLGERVATYVAKAGYTPNPDAVRAIVKASKTFRVNAIDLARLAILETGFDPNKKPSVNSNRTVDYGMFRINDVNRNTVCSEFDVETIEGNALCAAKIVADLKANWGSKDPRWIARFHSKTPALKHEYYRRYASL